MKEAQVDLLLRFGEISRNLADTIDVLIEADHAPDPVECSDALESLSHFMGELDSIRRDALGQTH
jgi:hypothetical protein